MIRVKMFLQILFHPSWFYEIARKENFFKPSFYELDEIWLLYDFEPNLCCLFQEILIILMKLIFQKSFLKISEEIKSISGSEVGLPQHHKHDTYS